jgi:hypothetical protein
MAIHQMHDHLVQMSPENLRRWRSLHFKNREIVGRDASRFTLLDSTHVLTAQGVRRASGFRHYVRMLDTLHLFHPRLAAPSAALRLPITVLRPFVQHFRNGRTPLSELKSWIVSELAENGLVGLLGVTDNGRSGVISARAIELARALSMSATPVILYDPSAEATLEAQRLLRGPFCFASSAEECITACDILILPTRRPEVDRLLRNVLDSGKLKCRVVDFSGSRMRVVPERAVGAA